jgi:LPXTG-motif cell wall-anchored protein
MKLKRTIYAAIPGAALLALATPAGATEARRLCGPEVELFDIVPHLDVEVNGRVFQSPNTGEWSITFDDEDGQFTVRYFNESGDWGSTSFDIGPAPPCEAEQQATTLAPAAPTSPSTAAAGVLSGSAEQPASAEEAAPESAQELPATGSNAALALLGAGLAVTGATVIRLVTRRNGATSNPA